MPDDNTSMWNVFISHSTNGTNGVALRILERLTEALPPTYLPMIDRLEIGGGDEWKKWIIRRLRDAHLGIVLLDPKAAESHWVAFESQFLDILPDSCQRLIPVFIGISRASVRAADKYGRYRDLLDRQTFEAEEPADEAAKDAEATRVCAEIMKRLVEFSDGLFEEDLLLVRRLKNYFSLFEGEAEELLDRHFREPVDDTKFRPFFIAELLAKRLLDAQLSEPAIDAVEDLTFMPGRACQARSIVLSSWITWPEAEPVRFEGHESGPRVLVLRTDSPFVAEQLVQRANGCVPSRSRWIPFDPAADGEVSSVSQMVDELFTPKGDSEYLRPCSEAEGKCRYAENPRYVLVNVVGGLEMSVRIVEEIHRKCPSIPVMLLVSPSIYDDARIRELLGGTYRAVDYIDEKRQERFLRARDDLHWTFERKGIA